MFFFRQEKRKGIKTKSNLNKKPVGEISCGYMLAAKNMPLRKMFVEV